MNQNNTSDDKSIDQLLAEYQQLENSVKTSKPDASKLLDRKAIEIQQMEKSMSLGQA